MDPHAAYHALPTRTLPYPHAAQVLKDYDLRFASYEERPWNRYCDRPV